MSTAFRNSLFVFERNVADDGLACAFKQEISTIILIKEKHITNLLLIIFHGESKGFF